MIKAFKNTPGTPPSIETPATEEKTMRSGWILAWEGFKILSVLLVVGFFLWKGYTVGRRVIEVRQELWFTYAKPELVKPIREIYENGHTKTDEDLKAILGVGK